MSDGAIEGGTASAVVGPGGARLLPTFLQTILLLVVGHLAALPVLLLTTFAIDPGDGTADPGWWAQSTAAAVAEKVLALGTALWLGQRFSAMSWRQVIPRAPPTLGQWAALAILLPGTALLAAFLGLPLREHLPAPGLRSSTSLLVLAVVAPLSEELFFRGLVLQGMLRRHRAWVAIAQSAVVFALRHLSPRQFVPTFVFGPSYGCIAVRTNSLWLPVAGHAGPGDPRRSGVDRSRRRRDAPVHRPPYRALGAMSP